MPVNNPAGQIICPVTFTGPAALKLPTILDNLSAPWTRRFVADLIMGAQGDSVSAIPEISGGASLTTPNPGTLALTPNGHKAVTTWRNTTNAYFSAPAITSGTDFTCIAVMMFAGNPAANRYPLLIDGLYISRLTNGNLSMAWDPYAVIGVPTPGVPVIVGLRRTATAAHVWFNTTTKAAAGAPAADHSAFAFGGADSQSLTPSLIEVMSAPVALTDDQMTTDITALRARYAVA